MGKILGMGSKRKWCIAHCTLATYDDPIQYPVGIEHVLVNGELVVHNNKVTGLTPGRAIP